MKGIGICEGISMDMWNNNTDLRTSAHVYDGGEMLVRQIDKEGNCDTCLFLLDEAKSLYNLLKEVFDGETLEES